MPFDKLRTRFLVHVVATVDAQALGHAEGEPSDALGRYPGQAGHLDDLADPGGRGV
jgi:hypothetical protein